jgi:ribosomal protein S18 acetylase RimI-like enzyme
LYSDFNFENFYYFAEIWVKNSYRWQNIAWQLYRQSLEQIKNNWVKYILVRTTKKTDVPYKWFLKELYQDVFSYNDEQDRVILAVKM